MKVEMDRQEAHIALAAVNDRIEQLKRKGYHHHAQERRKLKSVAAKIHEALQQQ